MRYVTNAPGALVRIVGGRQEMFMAGAGWVVFERTLTFPDWFEIDAAEAAKIVESVAGFVDGLEVYHRGKTGRPVKRAPAAR